MSGSTHNTAVGWSPPEGSHRIGAPATPPLCSNLAMAHSLSQTFRRMLPVLIFHSHTWLDNAHVLTVSD